MRKLIHFIRLNEARTNKSIMNTVNKADFKFDPKANELTDMGKDVYVLGGFNKNYKKIFDRSNLELSKDINYIANQSEETKIITDKIVKNVGPNNPAYPELVESANLAYEYNIQCKEIKKKYDECNEKVKRILNYFSTESEAEYCMGQLIVLNNDFNGLVISQSKERKTSRKIEGDKLANLVKTEFLDDLSAICDISAIRNKIVEILDTIIERSTSTIESTGNVTNKYMIGIPKSYNPKDLEEGIVGDLLSKVWNKIKSIFDPNLREINRLNKEIKDIIKRNSLENYFTNYLNY